MANVKKPYQLTRYKAVLMLALLLTTVGATDPRSPDKKSHHLIENSELSGLPTVTSLTEKQHNNSESHRFNREKVLEKNQYWRPLLTQKPALSSVNNSKIASMEHKPVEKALRKKRWDNKPPHYTGRQKETPVARHDYFSEPTDWREAFTGQQNLQEKAAQINHLARIINWIIRLLMNRNLPPKDETPLTTTPWPWPAAVSGKKTEPQAGGIIYHFCSITPCHYINATTGEKTYFNCKRRICLPYDMKP